MVAGLYVDMIPIDFGFSRSKVEATVFVYVEQVSTQYLEIHLWQTFIYHMAIALYEDMIPIYFGFSR